MHSAFACLFPRGNGKHYSIQLQTSVYMMERGKQRRKRFFTGYDMVQENSEIGSSLLCGESVRKRMLKALGLRFLICGTWAR